MGKKIIAIDVFCGGGGLTRGLVESGIRVVKGVDLDGTARETYEKNNLGSTFLEADIRKLPVDNLLDGIKCTNSNLLIAGCAPCQPFSNHTKGLKKYDSRRSLIMCFTKIIEKIMPEYIMIENVPGFRKKTNYYHTMFIRVLEKHGYYYDEKVVNAAEYGVPQSRKRYILLGSRSHKNIAIPIGRYAENGRRFKTVRDTIAKYPKISAGKISQKIPNHAARSLSKTNLRRIKAIPKNGGSMRDVPSALKLRCHANHIGHTDTYGRMEWDHPAPTLTCKCASLSNGRFGHPVQNRAITVREAAALQTFPDDYIFYSSYVHNSAHVGNAVPVLLAKEIGKVFTDITR